MDKQEKRKANKAIKLSKNLMLLYVEYIEKYECSLWFTIMLYDIIKSAIKTKNIDNLADLTNVLKTQPYNKKIEQELLNSIRYY